MGSGHGRLLGARQAGEPPLLLPEKGVLVAHAARGGGVGD